MTTMAKKELITATKARYLKSSKKEKGKILDEFCKNTGYNRNYASIIFQAKYDNNRVGHEGRKPRARIYDSDVLSAVIKIWEILEYPCGVRLKPQLLPMAKVLIRCKEKQINDEIMGKLKTISPKTLDRRLKKEREIRKIKRNRGTTRHGSLIKSSIPIRIANWDTNELGFMEMDTVAHNGGDPSGEFIYSLDIVSKVSVH